MNTNQMSYGQSNAEEKLIEELNKSYVSLAKWIITLSTGAIVFSIRLLTPHTSVLWKNILIFGLGLLIISVISGIVSVRLRIEFTGYNLQEIMNTKLRNYFSKFGLEEKHMFNGKETKVKDILESLDKLINDTNKKMGNLNDSLVALSNWQQCLFYLGIIAIATFGVFSI